MHDETGETQRRSEIPMAGNPVEKELDADLWGVAALLRAAFSRQEPAPKFRASLAQQLLAAAPSVPAAHRWQPGAVLPRALLVGAATFSVASLAGAALFFFRTRLGPNFQGYLRYLPVKGG